MKDNQLLFGTSIMEPIRDGESSMLTQIRDHKPRDLTRTSVSSAADHSTSSQDFQCTELCNLTELTTLLSTDTSREETTNNGSSTVLARLSDQTTGRTMLLKSNLTEDQPTSGLLQLSTQDGGRCLATRKDSLSMRKERL